ncbi:MAG: ribosomal protein, partial [Pseudomonadota bacterium]
ASFEATRGVGCVACHSRRVSSVTTGGLRASKSADRFVNSAGLPPHRHHFGCVSLESSPDCPGSFRVFGRSACFYWIFILNTVADSFAALFEESLKRQEMRSGEVITAEVVRIDHNYVVVNAGLKSESFIPIEEFHNDRGELDVSEGDFVSVAIDSIEDGYGETRLSRDRAKRLAAWINLEKALESGEPVTGTISGKVKGGLTVMTNGIRAFLPGSLIDTRPVKDTSPYEGKTLDFKVIKLDRKRNNVVLSRRAILELTQGEERARLLEMLREGAIVTGMVKNITDYGAFIDLGGIDGLLHITDMAWRRVRHPSEVLQVGQEITAKVLKFDQEKNRVSLGVKQLGDDPWVGIARRYPAGTRMFGKVTNITDYGAFVEIEPGIEGLVHVSEMDWTNKNVNPGKVVALGDETEVMVLEIDEERRRISLGMKQCRPNPWEEFADNHRKGDKVRGSIKSITDFGVFIGLPGGIDGLVHLSDLSWSLPGEEAVRNFKKGDEVEAVVLAIDTERERISLGIKQLEGDPFNNYASSHEKGAMVKGVVTAVDARGATISLGGDVEGYLRASEISRDRVEDARNHVKEGDEVEAMVINVDRKNRMISLSIKAKDTVETAEALQRMQAESGAASGTTNLGALLRAKLDKPQE